MFERCLFFNLNALTRRVNKIWEQAFEPHGLSPSHAYLLRLILNEPGLTQQEIATELRLEKSTITRFVDSLEKNNWLSRIKTGRERKVYPSKAAQQIHQELEAQGQALYQQMTDSIGEESLIELVGDLRNTTHNLN